MRFFNKKIISLILPVLILMVPIISHAGHGGGQRGGDPGLELPIDGGTGELQNNYSDEEIAQMQAAWVASGRSLNPSTDFDFAVNYASKLGMSTDDFIAGASNGDPNWNPGDQWMALKNAWTARGYPPGDFDATLQAALASGKTATIEDLEQQVADQLTEQQDLLDALKKYTDLYAQITAAIANGDPVDWEDIARQLGIDFTTPDDLWAKLQALNSYAQELLADAQARGMSPTAYLNYLLGKIPDSNGKFCGGSDLGGGTTCYDQTRQKLEAILKTPGQPNNGDNNDGGGQIKEPLNADSADASSTFLDNLRLQIPSLVRLVFALSYTIGVVFCIISIMKLKHIGESRSANSTSTGGLFSVMAYMITGTVLIYLPSTLNMTTGTFFPLGGDDSLFAYSNDAIAGMTYENLLAVVVQIVKLVGLIAFVRGLIMLSKTGSQSSHGTMSKSIVHIVAGILAVNIVTTWEVARATFNYAW